MHFVWALRYPNKNSFKNSFKSQTQKTFKSHLDQTVSIISRIKVLNNTYQLLAPINTGLAKTDGNREMKIFYQSKTISYKQTLHLQILKLHLHLLVIINIRWYKISSLFLYNYYKL